MVQGVVIFRNDTGMVVLQNLQVSLYVSVFLVDFMTLTKVEKLDMGTMHLLQIRSNQDYCVSTSNRIYVPV